MEWSMDFKICNFILIKRISGRDLFEILILFRFISIRRSFTCNKNIAVTLHTYTILYAIYNFYSNVSNNYI